MKSILHIDLLSTQNWV